MENESDLTFDEVDLKVVFVSERQEQYYTQRKFELINLLVIKYYKKEKLEIELNDDLDR